MESGLQSSRCSILGVPQRRRRIYLVADFRGECAGKVSFEREGLRGYFETGRTPWQTVAGDAENRTGTTDCEGDCVITVDQGGGKSGANFYHNLSPTLTGTHDGSPAVAYGWPLGFRPENTRVYEETATTICNGTRPGFTCGVIETVPTYALDQQGGKGGANYAENVMPTLCSDSHGTPHAVAYGISPYHSNAMKSSNPNSGIYVADTARTLDAMNCGYPGCNQGGIAIVEPLCMATQQGGAEIMEDKCPTITAAAGMSGNNQPVVTYSIENHPADSRVNIDATGKGLNLTSRMGTGGGNVPMVMEPRTVAIEGNGSHPSHRGDGWCESETMYTLNATEQHAVSYSLETFHCVAEEEMAAPLKARDFKDPLCVCIDRAYFNQGQNALYTPQTYEDGTTPTLVAMGPSAVAYGVDCRNATEYEESNGALQAACNHNHNSNNVVRIQYIVRRLTPTECARLQGFPDIWATPDKKTEFTDEEYKFWLNVRNTHAEINGKATKEYTKDQMLTWYNKLHTDSSEYKLWGNGIALPNALFVIGNIAEVLANG